MKVIKKVLVVGIGMDGFDMPFDYCELLFKYLQYRNDGICCTGSSRNDLLFVNIQVGRIVIHSVNDVWDIALSRSSKDDFCDTFCTEMP